MPDDYKNSQQPLLPNLNFKVRRGDSLVQRIGSKMFPVQEHANLNADLKRKITELKKLKVEFFNNKGHKTGYVRQQENLLFREILDAEINEKKRTLQGPIQQHGTQKGLFGIQDKTAQQVIQLSSTYREKLKQEIAELEEQNRNLKDEHPLIWNIEFAEIFFDKGGFDIIIGNPPYVRQEDIADPNGNINPKDYKAALQEMARMDFPKHVIKEMKIDGKSDLYTFFYVRSLNLLNTSGIHVFICSNSWLDVGYGVWLQYFLLKNVPMHFIIDNHARRSFTKSDINTIISVFGAPVSDRHPELVSGSLKNDKMPKQVRHDDLLKFIAFKQPFVECILTENLLDIEKTTNILKDEAFRVYPITHTDLQDEGSDRDNELDTGNYVGDKWGGKYLRAPDIFFKIFFNKKIIKMNEIAKVFPGCYSGINDFFYLSKNKIEQFSIEDEYLKPLIRSTKTIDKLKLSDNSENYVLVVDPIPKKDLKPNVRKYIEWGEKQVTRKRQKTKAGIPWPKTETVKNRIQWYSIPKNNLISTNLFMQYVANVRFYYPFSNYNLISDRCYHRIFLNDQKYFKELSLILNSTLQMFFVMLFGRANLGQGALKFESTDANKLFTLSPTAIAGLNIDQILDKIGNRLPDSIFQECGICPIGQNWTRWFLMLWI